jgi:hypothetical protein
MQLCALLLLLLLLLLEARAQTDSRTQAIRRATDTLTL